MLTIPLPPLPQPDINSWPVTLEKLRARDLEVARVVLAAAAQVCEHWSEQNHVYVNGALRCREDILKLEFKA